MPIVYVGRTSNQYGKTLWEILSNLKNFGVGRMIIRQTFQRYPEPCYYRILEVQAMLPEGDVRRVKALTDMVFRGRYWGQFELCESSYMPDFQLIPKTEEARLSGIAEGELPPGVEKDLVLPATGPLPPLFRELVIQSQQEAGKPFEEPLMKMQYILHANSRIRIAEENEEPMRKVTYKVVPKKPEMYKKVKEAGTG